MTFVLYIEKKKGGKAAMKKKMKKQQQKAKNRPVKKAEKEEKKVDIVGQEHALATDTHMDHSIKEFVRDITIPNFSRKHTPFDPYHPSKSYPISYPLPFAVHQKYISMIHHELMTLCNV